MTRAGGISRVARETIRSPVPPRLPHMSGRKEAAPSVRIRSYARADFSKVRRLWRESGLYPSFSDRRGELERARRRDPDLFLVAEQTGVLVGAVLGRFDGRRGWVNHLAVADDARRRGVGRRLMDELERRLAAKGCAKVNLHVEGSNAQVCGFYARLGYRRRELIFMEKWLRGGRP